MLGIGVCKLFINQLKLLSCKKSNISITPEKQSPYLSYQRL